MISDPGTDGPAAKTTIDVTRNVEAQLAADGANVDHLVNDAKAGTDAEHKLTLMEGLRKYPRAVFWSWLLSCAIIMTGFDIVLLGSFYALPQFTRKFGVAIAGSDPVRYTITAPWQAGLSNGAKCGEIIGLAVNGFVVERFGARKTMLTALSLLICWIFLSVFAQNIETLLAGQILMGTCWGIFETLTVTYAAEISPVALRHYLTSYVNLCWVIGQLIASGVLKGLLDWDSEWGFRLPFALQWVWPVPVLIGCIFAPESPWWLVRKGRIEDARRTIRRIRKQTSEEEMDAQLAMMIHTNAYEKTLAEGTSYKDCFKGVDLRRTEVAVGVWMIQNLCGSALMGYSTFFLEQAGLAKSNAFTMSIAQYALGALGTISSWYLMKKFGRRSLYFYGLTTLCGLLMIVGILGCLPQSNTGASWGVGAMLLVYTAVYDATIGPVCYCLVSEVSSTRLRAKTVVIARIFYNLMGIVINTITPYMLNETELNWRGKTGFFWGGMCFLCATWTFFRCPEPKGRTYGELDVLFHNRVSARKFHKTAADQFASHDTGISSAIGLVRSASDSSGEKGEKGLVQMREHADEHTVKREL
ncbi:hypothetical protein JCM11251_001946 [Rhodosporidiobolus azoricus]